MDQVIYRADIRDLGDGAFHDTLREIRKMRCRSPGLLSEDVESVARTMGEIIDQIDSWDEDAAWEVHEAALSYLEACERFCRERIEAGHG